MNDVVQIGKAAEELRKAGGVVHLKNFMLNRFSHVCVDQHHTGSRLGHSNCQVGAGGGFSGIRFSAGNHDALLGGGSQREEQAGADVFVGFYNLKRDGLGQFILNARRSAVRFLILIEHCVPSL